MTHQNYNNSLLATSRMKQLFFHDEALLHLWVFRRIVGRQQGTDGRIVHLNVGVLGFSAWHKSNKIQQMHALESECHQDPWYPSACRSKFRRSATDANQSKYYDVDLSKPSTGVANMFLFACCERSTAVCKQMQSRFD